MVVIRTFEYSSLSVNDVFTLEHFEQIVRFNEAHGNKYFSIGNRRVYFKNYVGTLQVGSVTIEILPKADRAEGDEAKNRWHNALVYMLHVCGYLNIESISDANLQVQKLTLVDLFYKNFLSEVKVLCHQGLIRKYRYEAGNRNFLKGRLIFSKHIAQNQLHKERFYTSSQVYDHDNVYNQILLKALKILKYENKGSHFLNDICSLLYYFENITDPQILKGTFDGLYFNRNTTKYERAITLARLIIQNYSPDIKAGVNPVVGLLFDMNTLYEKVIYRLLKTSESRYWTCGLKLTSQRSRKFWKNSTIRPDILGEYISAANQTKKRFVIDTKWKQPTDGKPSDTDLKQMFAYNVHFGASASFLVYPESESRQPTSGVFHDSSAIKEECKVHHCSTFYIQIFDSKGRIKRDAGDLLLRNVVNEN